MKTINVTVRDKIASAVGDIVYICGNSDYVINFDFDAEWDDYDVKTARFVHDGSYIDVVFTGNQCAMPVIHKAYGIYVGIYAGDLRTTTPAHIPSAASILSAEGTPEEPPDDVYAQIIKLCNEAVAEATSVRNDADAGKFNGAPGKTPVAGTDYFTEADKQAIAAEAAQGVGFPKPTSADNGKYLVCENGAAKWMPVEASGGGDKWELINEFTIPEGAEESNSLSLTKDSNGNDFVLKKALLLSNFPPYTGESTIPNFSFASINGFMSGSSALVPNAYTSAWPTVRKTSDRGGAYFVDVSGIFQIEKALKTDTSKLKSNGKRVFTNINSTDCIDKEWMAIPKVIGEIHEIGGRGMLIYPGCWFALYGVRA